MTERWSPFKDRELRTIVESLRGHGERTARRLIEEIVVEADARGPYRAKHIFDTDDESARRPSR